MLAPRFVPQGRRFTNFMIIIIIKRQTRNKTGEKSALKRFSDGGGGGGGENKRERENIRERQSSEKSVSECFSASGRGGGGGGGERKIRTQEREMKSLSKYGRMSWHISTVNNLQYLLPFQNGGWGGGGGGGRTQEKRQISAHSRHRGTFKKGCRKPVLGVWG